MITRGGKASPIMCSTQSSQAWGTRNMAHRFTRLDDLLETVYFITFIALPGMAIAIWALVRLTQ